MVAQVVVNWSGGRIGSGASIIHFQSVLTDLEASGAVSRVRTFFDAIKANFNTDIVFNFPTEVRQLNDATGDLEAIWPVPASATVTGTSSTQYANGAGGLLRLSTDEIVGNRRLLGRVFLVPLAVGAFDGNGDIQESVRTAVNTAAGALRSSSVTAGTPWMVWSRKFGTTGVVSNALLQPRPALLRSRNDK